MSSFYLAPGSAFAAASPSAATPWKPWCCCRC